MKKCNFTAVNAARFQKMIETRLGPVRVVFSQIFNPTEDFYFITVYYRREPMLFRMEQIEDKWKFTQRDKLESWLLEIENQLSYAIKKK